MSLLQTVITTNMLSVFAVSSRTLLHAPSGSLSSALKGQSLGIQRSDFKDRLCFGIVKAIKY